MMFETMGAELSADQKHRYTLFRRWSQVVRKTILWIMLNPSRADARYNDPTVMKCVGFSKLWGADMLWVGNLFSYRATHPTELMEHYLLSQPTFVKNDLEILRLAALSETVVVAWGNHGNFLDRGEQMKLLLKQNSIPISCLGTNENGTPKHPLDRRLSYTTPLRSFT